MKLLALAAVFYSTMFVQMHIRINLSIFDVYDVAFVTDANLNIFDMYEVTLVTGKKGGALASSIFSYMQHGDPYVRGLIKHTLTLVRWGYLSQVKGGKQRLDVRK